MRTLSKTVCLQTHGGNSPSLGNIAAFIESTLELYDGNPGPLTAELFEIVSSHLNPTQKSS